MDPGVIRTMVRRTLEVLCLTSPAGKVAMLRPMFPPLLSPLPHPFMPTPSPFRPTWQALRSGLPNRYYRQESGVVAGCCFLSCILPLVFVELGQCFRGSALNRTFDVLWNMPFQASHHSLAHQRISPNRLVSDGFHPFFPVTEYTMPLEN